MTEHGNVRVGVSVASPDSNTSVSVWMRGMHTFAEDTAGKDVEWASPDMKDMAVHERHHAAFLIEVHGPGGNTRRVHLRGTLAEAKTWINEHYPHTKMEWLCI